MTQSNQALEPCFIWIFDRFFEPVNQCAPAVIQGLLRQGVRGNQERLDLCQLEPGVTDFSDSPGDCVTC